MNRHHPGWLPPDAGGHESVRPLSARGEHGRRSGAAPLRAAMLLVPAFVALGVSVNTLPGEFVFDDTLLIEKNARLKDFDLDRVLWSNYWGTDRHDVNYRPVTLLSFALNYRAGKDAVGFRIINLLLNAGVVMLALAVLREVVSDERLVVLGACVYAVLPIHTEAVAWVAGRAELLAALCVLGSWLVLLTGPPKERWLRATAAGFVFFLGLCSKESAAVLIPLALATPVLLGRRIPWKGLSALAGFFVVYLVLRFAVLHDAMRLLREGLATSTTFVDNPLIPSVSDPLTRVVNAVRLLGLYAWKTVVPVHLSVDYSYNQIPVLPLDSAVLWLGALASCAVFAGGWLFLRRRAPVAALGFVFFPLAFSVTANLLFPIGTIFGERLAYLPSLGLVLAIVGALDALALNGFAPRSFAYALLALLTLCYGARTFARNTDWRTKVALYRATRASSPRSTRAQGLGAEAALIEAIRATPANEKERLFAEAHAALDRALEIHPQNGRAMGRRGETYLREAEFAASRGDGPRAARLFRASRETFTQAMETLRKNHQWEPLYLVLRGQASVRLAEFEAAFQDLDQYVQTQAKRGAPPTPLAFNYRGLARAALAEKARASGDTDAYRRGLTEALSDFDRAVGLAGRQIEFLNNRGFCRFKLGDLDGALEDYRRGLEVCLEDEVLYAPGQDSAVGFLLKIAACLRARGDEAAAQRYESRAAALRAAAAR